jgi:ribosomal-protein-alanine N-acetyltransferase
MGYDDLDRVMEIEKTVYEFPWTRGNFADSISSGYHCIVMESGGFLAGYGVMLLASSEASLLNLSVAKNWQNMGMGRKLLEHFISLARGEGAKDFYLEARQSNTVAIALYSSSGFDELCVRPNYYPASEGRENAVMMRKLL